jgi:hypothetical protein
VQHAHDVGLELAAVVGDRERFDGADHAEARVGDDDVEAAERLHGRVDRRADLVFLRDVAAEREGLAAEAFDVARELLEQVGAARGDGNVGALAGELQGEGPARA